MKFVVLFIISVFTHFQVSTQQYVDYWDAFWNANLTLIGYKDQNGVEQIEQGFGFYYTLFDEPNYTKYPLLGLVINQSKGKRMAQNHFEFI